MTTPSAFPTSYDSSHPDEAPVPLPSAPRRAVADDAAGLFLQPPLSRRGRGPGIIMFLPPAASPGTARARTLDPDPVHKWAEEGFAVLGIPAGASSPEALGQTVQRAVGALRDANECTTKDRFAVIGVCQSRASLSRRASAGSANIKLPMPYSLRSGNSRAALPVFVFLVWFFATAMCIGIVRRSRAINMPHPGHRAHLPFCRWLEHGARPRLPCPR